jgi:hypothetical protein
MGNDRDRNDASEYRIDPRGVATVNSVSASTRAPVYHALSCLAAKDVFSDPARHLNGIGVGIRDRKE